MHCKSYDVTVTLTYRGIIRVYAMDTHDAERQVAEIAETMTTIETGTFGAYSSGGYAPFNDSGAPEQVEIDCIEVSMTEGESDYVY